MTEMINGSMLASSLIANINTNLTQLDDTQNELSTGYKINEPSDDPYGASEAIGLQGQIAALGSYSSNVTDGTAWAETASSALQDIQQVTERVRELTVEAANGTDSQSDLDDAAQEVDQLIAQVKSDANTQYNGSYVFSGTATETAPYETGGDDTYQGNTGTVTRTIGPGTSLTVSADLSSVLGNGGTDGGLLSTLRTIAADMTSGNTSGLGSDLTSIDANTSALESLQTDVGETQDRLSLASSRLTSLTSTDTEQLGNVEDVDEAQATIQFSTEQAAYEAALQSGSSLIQTSLMQFLQT